MNSKIRIKAKALLSGNTARLFLVSFTSFLFRYGACTVFSYTIFYCYKSAFLSQLAEAYGKYLVYGCYAVLTLAAAFIFLLFISGIRLGESFVYFTRANGGRGNFRALFKFLSPRQSFRALRIYLQITAQKLLWFVYFFIPVIICIGCIYNLYSNAFISQAVYIILSVGASIILAFAFVMCRISHLRLSASPYYLCLRENLSPSGAIKKSILFTDGFLSEGVVLEYSLIGWILSCLLIIPAFYAIPYYKLVKAVFVTEAIFSKSYAKTRYAVNILNLA